MTDVEVTPEERPRFEIDPWERIWLTISVLVLSVFAAALIISTVGFGFDLPGVSGRVDPTTVTDEGPFATPGLVETGDGTYVAYMVARQYAFDPGLLTVPQGAEVTFRITSIDVQHGFKVAGTNVNMMVLPGQISELTATFDDLGEFPFVCSEFCSIGHAQMAGSLSVVPPEEFEP